MAPKSAPRWPIWRPSWPQESSTTLWCSFLHSFLHDTSITWPSSLPQEIQHGVQVGTQEVVRSPASPQVGPLKCNIVPAGTQVGPEIPTMAPESADLGHLWAVLGHLGAVGRKSTNAGFIFRKKLPGSMFSQSSVPAQKSEADEVDEMETVSATAAPTSPCHRTGGKDFGSLLRDAVQA